MTCIVKWRPKHPGARFAVAFRFGRLLDAVDSASLTIEAVSGTDADPGDVFDGAPQITGADVYQRVRDGVSGVNYLITCTAIRGDDRHVLQALLPVRSRC